MYVACRSPDRPGDVPRATRPSGGVRGTICTPLHDHAAILVTVKTLHFWAQKGGEGGDWPSALIPKEQMLKTVDFGTVLRQSKNYIF